ncbi:MAG TPA: DUF4412 domain-containing protein [Verrucomicrobiae bacterium]|nr:DUF4412 domain-containing protein [Verrucomicrobiae bacterium]
MKKQLLIFAAAVLAAGTFQLGAQPSGGSGGPQFDKSLEKLFGDNQVFSATLEVQMNSSANSNKVSGKMSFENGNLRFETDMADMKGQSITPEILAHMKSLGMDHMVNISLPDQKTIYVIYPNAQAYVEVTVPPGDSSATNGNVKLDTTELGKETVDGHPCVKNKDVITDSQGEKHEFTVWNATDLKNFPIKIEVNQEDNDIVETFKDISFTEPDASQFSPPANCTKYDSVQEMMQSVMMKHMGGTMPPN